MALDTMEVRLHFRLIRVLCVVVDALDELVVAVVSTRSRSRCPHCGFSCRRVHDVRPRSLRDLAVSGRPVTLVWNRRWLRQRQPPSGLPSMLNAMSDLE